MPIFNTREEAFTFAWSLARSSESRESYSVSRRLHKGVVTYHVYHAAIIHRPCQFERMGHEFLGIASP